MKKTFLAFVAWMAGACLGAPLARGEDAIPRPQLSPYLYLIRGDRDSYLNYREATRPQTPFVDDRYTAPAGRATRPGQQTNAPPSVTGIAPTIGRTGHADPRGADYIYRNTSHYYTVRSAPRQQ